MSFYDDASLIMYPSGYKEDKIYSLKPTDGSGDLTFTRASSATRVNAEGLIENMPYNLLEYSEQFDNAAWLKVGGAVTANAGVSPNGQTTADRFYIASAASNTRLYALYTFAAQEYTLSVYAKNNGSTDSFRFSYYDGVSQEFSSDFSLTNEWQRFTHTFTAATGAGAGVVWIANTSSTGVGSELDLLIWGAQLNSGSTAKTYFPTTDRLNVPRIDYTGGGCGKLLLEKQSTNLALESESLISSPWFSGTGTENADIAPDGTQSATLITNLLTRQNISVTVQPYTVSVFIKGSVFRLELGSVFGSNCFVIFNTSTETFTSVGTSVENYGFEKYINGWYRIFLTDTPANSGIGQVQLKPVGGLEMLIWGAQLEQGSYATSYIPTSGATVTRLADSASKTGISSLIGQTEGTMFVDFIYNHSNTSISENVSLSDGSSANRLYIGNVFANTLSCVVITSSVLQFSAATSYDLVIGQRYKAAICYKLNDFSFYVNGVEIATGTSGSVPLMNRIGFDSGSGTSQFYKPTQELLLFPSALTDSELETLTTL